MAVPILLSLMTIAAAFGTKVVRAGGVLFSSDPDKADAKTAGSGVIMSSGQGAPGGSYGTNIRGVYLREEAPTVDTLIYLCVNGTFSAVNVSKDFGATGPKADAISESTSGAGVTIDGLLVKDKGIDASALLTGEFYLKVPTNKADALSLFDSAGDILVLDTTTGAQRLTITPAVTITGILTLAATPLVDAIAEKTSGAGVTVDGCLIKDGRPLTNDFVKAVITVPNVTGGGTDAAATLQLYQLDGVTPVVGARQVLVQAQQTQYKDVGAEPFVNNVSFPAATIGSVVNTAAGYAVIETDATGAAAFTVRCSDDITVWFLVKGAASVSDLAKTAIVASSVADSAAWSA
jgi:hypothetical protein